MEALINRFILNEKYGQPWCIRELRRQLAKDQYVHLPNLFTAEVFSLLRTEVDRLEQLAIEKNYVSEYENTPEL